MIKQWRGYRGRCWWSGGRHFPCTAEGNLGLEPFEHADPFLIAVIVEKSSQGGEGETPPLVFPFDRVADRMARSIGARDKRLNVIRVDSDEEGCKCPSGFPNIERFVGNVGGGGGGGGGEREFPEKGQYNGSKRPDDSRDGSRGASQRLQVRAHSVR